MNTGTGHQGAPARDERGLSESVQWSLVAIAVLSLLLGAVQTATALHARACASEAALAGAQAQAASGAGTALGTQVARQVAGESGFHGVEVHTGGDAAQVRVEVTIAVERLMPGGLIHVHATAVAPRER